MNEYELTITFKDVILSKESLVIPDRRLGCFVHYDDKFVKALGLDQSSQQAKPDSVTFVLEESLQTSDPKVSFVVKDF